MAIPTLSVIIPTRNAGATLSELLSMLSVQTVSVQEVIVIDSSSVDRTTDIAKQYGANIVTINKENFDHGGTRTKAAEQAKGEIVVFLTQDAIPASRDALENLIKPFSFDDDIAVSYGRQLPSFEANVFAAHLRYFNYPDQSEIRSYNDKNRMGLRTIFTSNSFCAYRVSVLRNVDYFQNGLIFGEDTCTVGRILMLNKKIAYVSEACVYHSHNYSVAEEFRRYFDIGVLHSMENWILDTFGTAEKRGWKFLQSEISYLISEKKYHLLPVSLTRVVIKLIGYKLGRHYSFFPKRVILLLSMNKAWWSHRDELTDLKDIH